MNRTAVSQQFDVGSDKRPVLANNLLLGGYGRASQTAAWTSPYGHGSDVRSWRLVEIPRARQDTHVARVPVRRLARRLRVGHDVGAGQLHIGFVVF
jgi:hypothetical protein